jgi:DNA polymerase III subunit epsilon
VSAPANWYRDPWSRAELRWWDGTQWTGWTHPPAPRARTESDAGIADPVRESIDSTRRVSAVVGDAPRQLDRRSGLEEVLAGADRIAVIDVETTGLYRTDRIVEIAIITMDSSGLVIDEFETLVNPYRDPGPTWIHGVTASMLVDAPAFDDIAGHVAARLDGAVVVAHNLRFDTKMVGHEFSRTGIDVEWGDGLDTLDATGCKLGVACAEYGIAQLGAHRALFDARATGQLLLAVADQFTRTCHAVAARPVHHEPPRRILTRDGVTEAPVDTPYLADLARGVCSHADVAPYVILLDRAVADLQLTASERSELANLADELGLDPRGRERAHREFLNGLIDAALEDSVVTDVELDQLCRLAALLQLNDELVTRRTNPYCLAEDKIALQPGMQICFTGSAIDDAGNPIDRETVLYREAREHGLVPKRSFSKSCGLVIAADVASQSSKITDARRYGTPVATLADFRRALTTGTPLAVTRLSTAGVGQVCKECGSSWMAARRSSNPVCPGCREGARKVNATAKRSLLKDNVGVVAPPPPTVQTLVCIDCLATWERPRIRGRQPHRCPTCAGKEAGVLA